MFKKTYLLFIFSLFILLNCNLEESSSTNNTAIIEQNKTVKNNTMTFIDTHEKTHKINIAHKKFIIHNISQKIVILNFFDKLNQPNANLLKNLTHLQKKYNNKIFVISLFIKNDNIRTVMLENFIHENHLTHYISDDIENSYFKDLVYESLSLEKRKKILPMSIIYINSHYLLHYTGEIPNEMLQYEIQEAIKNNP